MNVPSRTPTTFAVGFLLLDAILLAVSGLALSRPGLILAGAAFALGAGAVIFAWRRYARALVDIAAARAEMRREVEALRELLHDTNHHS